MIVIDASVLGPALANDEELGDRLRSRIRDEELIAPTIIDLEIASQYRRGVRHGLLDNRRCDVALTALANFRVERVHHTGLLQRVWQLRDTVTAYDAAYVALAEALGTSLLTGDRKLANAPGPRCRFEVMQ